MQKNLKTKLENMSKEQLLALMDELCQLPDVRKMVKAMVSPNKNDIDRMIQNLTDCCERFMCNSCNAKDYDRMVAALAPIYGVYRFADIKLCAYITEETYSVLCDNGIEDYYELIGDMISDLSVNMQQHPNEFTADERKRYAEIAGE